MGKGKRVDERGYMCMGGSVGDWCVDKRDASFATTPPIIPPTAATITTTS